MPTQTSTNQNFVPRFLTKPWEDAKKNLKLYSFDSKEFETEPGKTALASAEDYPKELETFLSKHVEAPINELREQLQRGDDVLNQARYHRAATLLVSLQRTRNRAVSEAKWLSELKKPDEFLESLGPDLGQSMVWVPVEAKRPLWFPSSGSFYLLGKDLVWNGRRFVPVVALPIDQHRVLIGHDVGPTADAATKSGIKDVIAKAAPSLLEHASAGMDTATRVAVPPAMKGSDEDLAAMLQEARAKNKLAIAEHNRAVSPNSSSSED